MRISNPGGAWQCAEITSTQPLGFGTFQFWVDGPVDQLDKNIVLGLFQYGGTDGINEQDIEFSQFGDPPSDHMVTSQSIQHRPDLGRLLSNSHSTCKARPQLPAGMLGSPPEPHLSY